MLLRIWMQRDNSNDPGYWSTGLWTEKGECLCIHERVNPKTFGWLLELSIPKIQAHSIKVENKFYVQIPNWPECLL